SLEELFLIGNVGGALGLPEDGVAVSWRTRVKPQPPRAKFRIPPVDAPNVNGAKDLGFPVKTDAEGGADLAGMRKEVERGGVKALYVFDPGPEGSIGDVSWIIDAKRAGTIQVLIVHGVLRTPLAQAADVVLPGTSWVEKDAAYVNMDGRLQGASRAITAPGAAREDWQVFVNVGMALGVPLTYTNSAAVRADVAVALAGNARYAALATMAFSRPVSARTWLQASNPSERWKWDFMFQDLPPVKFAGMPAATSLVGGLPLREVK
ncbi:MAG: molybdopterin-dependent oxidoreductase, partial [Acidobacteria bacterium]|nr:molybdopterin-dependent oxidoreductase [Acidobacteriota bacterium]